MVSLFDVVGVGVENDHIFLALYLDVGCLDGAVPAFLALSLIELADCIDLPHHLMVDGDPLFRVKLLLV